MANPYYQVVERAQAGTTVRSALFNDNNDAIQQGFERLPSPLQLFSGSANFAVSTGTEANVYNVEINPSLITGYSDGITIQFRAHQANTGAVQVNLNGIGNRQVLSPIGTQLATGDILLNSVVIVRYNATTAQFTIDNALTAINPAIERARQWAENPEDVAVLPGQFSAMHWAIKSAFDAGRAQEIADSIVSTGDAQVLRVQTEGNTQVQLAITQAQNAESSAQRASTSESNASTSESNAATSEQNTQTLADQVAEVATVEGIQDIAAAMLTGNSEFTYDDVLGIITFTAQEILSATINRQGIVQLSNSITGDREDIAATERAVRLASLSVNSSLGGVGTYAMLYSSSGTSFSPGADVSASDLRYSTADGNVGGASPQGTWRLMGVAQPGNDRTRVSIFLRVA